MRLQIRQTHSVGVLAAFTIATMVVAVIFLLWELRDRELEHARLETIALTQMLMEQTEQNFESADLVLQGVQERLTTAYGRQFALDSLPIHLLLNNRLSGMRQLRSIFVIDAQGMLINSSRDFPIPRSSVADRGYYKVFAQGRAESLFIDRPVHSRIDNSWTLHLSRRLTGSDGKFRGVVVAAINISQLEQLYENMKLDYVRPIAIY